MLFKYKNSFVRYSLKGKPGKTAVLAVHGFTENRKMWKPLYKALDEDYFFILPDLLGHGKTTFTGAFLTMEEQAEMLASLLNFQGIDQAVVIGHSMGGYIALAFAEMFPEKLRGLILLNSHPFADSKEKRRARAEAVTKAENDKFAFVAEAIPGFFAPYNREKFKREIDELVREASRGPVAGITGALRGMALRKDRSAYLFDKTPYPKAWLISRDDPLIDFKAFETAAAKSADLFFRVMQGGHMSYVESPEEMIAFVSEFLETI